MKYLRLSEERKLPRMVTIQNEYNLLNRQFEPELAETSMREDIGLLAWSPLATGMLTGKYTNHKENSSPDTEDPLKIFPPKSRWSVLAEQKAKIYRNTPMAHKAVSDYISLAQRMQIDPVKMALSFVVSQPFVTSCIIGATTMQQLRTNLQYHEVTITRELLEEIRAIRKKYPIPY